MSGELARDDNHITAAGFESSTTPGLVLSGKIDQVSGRVLVNGVGAGSGDVVGPSSATDNAVARFDTTTGKLIQNSTVIVSDAGLISTTAIIADVSGASGVTPGTFIVDSSIASQPALNAKNANNFAHQGNIALFQMLNGSDAGDVVQINNNGTGFTFLLNNGSGTVSTFSKNGSWQPPTVADASAANNSVYFSSDAAKLVYKDSSAVVHALY